MTADPAESILCDVAECEEQNQKSATAQQAVFRVASTPRVAVGLMRNLSRLLVLIDADHATFDGEHWKLYQGMIVLTARCVCLYVQRSDRGWPEATCALID